MALELTEALLSQAAGWEAMKLARAYLDQGKVLSSFWEPPLLRGVVQTGDASFRASMVIKSGIDVENLCSCPEARRWGKICAHGVAVGLHWIRSQKPAPTTPTATAKSPAPPPALAAKPKRTPSLVRSPEGEPAELFFVLPPNFETAAARGKIMLVLEARWAGGRQPLNALPKGRPFAFSEAENRALDQLEFWTDGETPGVLQLDAAQFAALLPHLVGHPNLSLGKSREITVRATPWHPPLQATLAASGEITLSLVGPPSGVIRLGDWVWCAGQLRPAGASPLVRQVLTAPMRLERAQVPLFLAQQWPALQSAGNVTANFRLEDFQLAPQPPQFLLHLKGGTSQLSALLQCAYGARIFTAGVSDPGEGVWLPDPASPTRYSTRDLTAEQSARQRLQRSGFTGPDAQGRWQLTGQSSVLNFLAREFPRLEKEWNVSLEEQLQNRTLANLERIEPQFQITSSGVEWFNLGVVFASGSGQTFSAADIQQLLRSGQNHTRLKNGKFAVVDTGAVEDLQEVLLDCNPQQDGQGYRIGHQQAGFLEATLRQHDQWRVQAPAEWRARAAQQTGEAACKCPPLDDLEKVLRPYQKQGVGWLHFLRENRFGGILADEMGLGKTLQTLAFLRSVRERQPGLPPVLIVCPTSLVFNWLAEVRRFTPTLKTLALHGPDRHPHFAQIADCDVVVTSYALLRRDADRYRGREFDTLVLDEAQHIKNRQTQNAQAVKAVRARHRLVLTGTPMENSVQDLWSIFDFLMPGYLGSARDFRERYELPIVKEKDGRAQARLARRLRPFLLRRLKKEVAADLPDKLELVSYCELTDPQRAVYEQIIDATRREVLAAEGPDGLAKSRMMVLTALLRLRQVCCDLSLLNLPEVNPETSSGKLDLFDELMEEIIDGGHRVLVFSQFVGMLTKLKDRLAAEQISYCYLDGSTVDRGAVVERFQKDPSIPVFLISLKAGGTGLNLTGADTVIHFDPWWNPAVEDQATSRAHRIGQTRVVTSYKLITRDTVEEKILTLQQRKREIIRGTVGDEAEFASSLSWEEIRELLN